MCCFSRPIRHVASTRIFARRVAGSVPAGTTPAGPSHQVLAYQMHVQLDEALAMVLPLPVLAGAGDDVVTFIDLSGYDRFLQDIDAAFPAQISRAKGPMLLAAQRAPRPRLTVHSVGAFVASYVPSPDDFDRLDPRFRISPALFTARPAYRDWGFAVFQLKSRRFRWLPGRKQLTVHPMALRFPVRDPADPALYFPTVHLHDGTVPDRARYDHALYYQTEDPVLAVIGPGETSPGPARQWVDPARSGDLVDGDRPLHKLDLGGEHRNVDVWLRAPACTRPVTGRGECWSFKLNGSSAYLSELHHDQEPAQARFARVGLDRVHDALTAGLTALAAAQRGPWHLAPLTDQLPHVATSNDQPMTWGPRGPEYLPAGEARPCRIDVPGWATDVDAQVVSFGFSHVPSPAILRAARDAISALLVQAARPS